MVALGYQRTNGNRWVRSLPGERSATVDLLVPSYRTRLWSSVQHGSTNTTEVGWLAEALRRPAVRVVGDVALSDGDVISLDVLLPDLASLPGFKLQARRVRQVDRDAVDLPGADGCSGGDRIVLGRRLRRDPRSARDRVRGRRSGDGRGHFRCQRG